SLGSVIAPLLATCIALRSGWRHAFVVTGVLGLAWIPVWLWVSRHAPAAPAPRSRVCVAAGVVSRGPAALPWAPSPGWAAAGISLSIFAVAAFSVNMYTLPLDTFGAAPAAFAISILVSE